MTGTAQCPGPLKVSYVHSHGGWSSDCEVLVEVECPQPRCWWPGWTDEARADRKTWTIPQLVALQADHDAHATVGIPS